jgi:hypothetical protein
LEVNKRKWRVRDVERNKNFEGRLFGPPTYDKGWKLLCRVPGAGYRVPRKDPEDPIPAEQKKITA